MGKLKSREHAAMYDRVERTNSIKPRINSWKGGQEEKEEGRGCHQEDVSSRDLWEYFLLHLQEGIINLTTEEVVAEIGQWLKPQRRVRVAVPMASYWH